MSDLIEPIIAINKKYQTTINRFIRWDKKYNAIVEETDDSCEGKQGLAYDKAHEYFHELPKREQKNLSKHFPTIGY